MKIEMEKNRVLWGSIKEKVANLEGSEKPLPMK